MLTMLAACDNVYIKSLVSGDQLQSAGGAEFISTLTTPKSQQTQTRLLFFVDQSYSMIHGRCPSDLDGPQPKSASSGCAGTVAAKGIDPEADRYEVIKKWIHEVKDNKNTKIAIFPFSGGMSTRPRQNPYNNTPISDSVDYYKFMDATKALSRVDMLVAEQNADLEKGTDIDEGNFVGSAPTYLGTTVPLPTLEFARDQIMKEMEALQKTGQLFATQFRVIYLSDGVFKPTDEVLDKAMILAGHSCSKRCVKDPRKISCDSGYLIGFGQLTTQEKKEWPLECGVPINSWNQVNSCFCLNIGNDFYEAFGDPSLNQLQKLLSVLEEIKTLPKYFGEGSLRMDFVKIHPERILEDDDQNIFDEMQKKTGDSAISAIVDGSIPFSLNSAQAAQQTYQLVEFYAVNLNAFIDETGKLVADSDGDGLSDQEEIRLGTDPRNPRTPDANGKSWCLDSIEKKYGCKKTNCDPALDSDNDGLNECEELTLETDTFRKENGQDHILDYFKAIRGLSFAADLRKQDSNGDGVSDYTSFKNGVHPLASFSAVPEESKIKARVQFKGYVESKEPDGSKALVGQYLVSIDQIPLVATLATTVGSQLYQSKNATPGSLIADNILIGPTPHRRNENELLFIAKVKSIQDPLKNYYMFARKKVLATGKQIKLQVDFSDFVQLPGN